MSDNEFTDDDAYLGAGGLNFSSESESEDLANMFVDLAAAQGADVVQDYHPGGGGTFKRTAKRRSEKTKRVPKKKKTIKKKGGADEKPAIKVDKPKAPKAPKAEQNDSEFIHYAMVTDAGKEVGDYRVRRGKQGPAAAAAKAATRYINDHKLKDKSSGNFTVTIRQTTRGQGYKKIFKYRVEFKKEKASEAFKKMVPGREYVLKKKLTAI